MAALQDPSLERCFKGHKNAVTSVAFNSNMKQVVSGSVDGSVMLWHFKTTLRAFRFLGHTDAVYSVAYDGTNNLIASASKDKTVRLWQPTVEGRSTVLKAHTAAVRCCTFSQNGKMLATCSDDKTVKVWSVPGQKFLFCLNGHTNWVRSCQLSPDARMAVSASDDRSVRIWDLETRTAVQTFEELDGAVGYVVKFHPDGTCVATGSSDGSIKLWDLRSSRLIQYYEAHQGAVTDLSFHPSGNFLLSSSMDTSLKIWDLQEGLLFYTLNGHEGATTGVSFSPDGTQFASCGADHQVMVWRTNFDQCLGEYGATVAVAGELDAPTEKAVREKLAQLRGPSQRPGSSHSAASKPPGTARGSNIADMKPAATVAKPASHQQHDTIKAVPAGRQLLQQHDGSHAVYESLSVNAGELPEAVATTLQHIVSQLDMLTQTVAVMEERLTISEDRTRRLETALANVGAPAAQAPATQLQLQPSPWQPPAIHQVPPPTSQPAVGLHGAASGVTVLEAP
ncbi:hypothetical protein N2152v2_004082 [Parachlorella kessleri]